MATVNPYLRLFYAGELAAPIPRPENEGLLSALTGDDERHLNEQRLRKVPALFAHFDIDPNAPDAWQRLALALAAGHVPGFALQPLPVSMVGFGAPPLLMLKRKRGRPRKRASVPPPLSGRGLLSFLQEPAPKRAPGRPPTLTIEQKRSIVQQVEQRIAAVKQANPKCSTRKAAAELEFGELAKWVLSSVARFKLELQSDENSKKFADTERIFRDFVRST